MPSLEIVSQEGFSRVRFEMGWSQGSHGFCILLEIVLTWVQGLWFCILSGMQATEGSGTGLNVPLAEMVSEELGMNWHMMQARRMVSRGSGHGLAPLCWSWYHRNCVMLCSDNLVWEMVSRGLVDTILFFDSLSVVVRRGDKFVHLTFSPFYDHTHDVDDEGMSEDFHAPII